jgi:hypothetical protein
MTVREDAIGAFFRAAPCLPTRQLHSALTRLGKIVKERAEQEAEMLLADPTRWPAWDYREEYRQDPISRPCAWRRNGRRVCQPGQRCEEDELRRIAKDAALAQRSDVPKLACKLCAELLQEEAEEAAA